MAPTTSNIDENDTETSQRRIKRRRLLDTENQDQSSSSSDNDINSNKWRSPKEQQTYSSKLIEALRHVRRRSSSQQLSTVTTRSRVVRETADKVLAVAAKGRTRWSRAILKNRVKMRLRNHHKKVRSPESNVMVVGGMNKLRGGGNINKGVMIGGGGDKRRKLLPELEKRVQVLGQLVPGCRKLPFANLLEEATDYIAALQMQVRAMAALAGLLTARSGAGSEGESSSSSRLELGGSHDDENRR